MGKINLTIADLPFSAEEAMNRLRVNVRFSGASTKKIMITSSIPNEGKSHISVYLWKMLSDAGYRTVLIDADLRKSVLKDELKFQTEEKEIFGLDHYLAGISELGQILYETNVENGYFIPCVNLLENPSPLLEDPRLLELLNQLSEKYDYVIIDTPPLVSVSDGAMIGALCDGTILVVRSGFTPRTLVNQSLHQLHRAGARLLGTVLNGVETQHHGYGKYYGGYYKYYKYYGDYETRKSSRKGSHSDSQKEPAKNG